MSDLNRNPAIDPDELSTTAINIDSLLAILEARLQGEPDDIGTRTRSWAEVCGEELILQSARLAAQHIWDVLVQRESATVTPLGGES